MADAVAVIAGFAALAYALLGGADFGGGVWDFFAFGPRRQEQRAAIANAMGPVWEANHVWLIFLIVILFTAFPPVYATLSTALFTPFHLVLLGIVTAFEDQIAQPRPPIVEYSLEPKDLVVEESDPRARQVESGSA